MATSSSFQSKAITRRVKRVQEMRNQLENLRKELVGDAEITPDLETAIDSCAKTLDKLAIALHYPASAIARPATKISLQPLET